MLAEGFGILAAPSWRVGVVELRWKLILKVAALSSAEAPAG